MLTANNLELAPWITQDGPDINPIPADSFTATLISGGVLKVVNKSSKNMGGALVTCKPKSLLPANTLANPYFGLDLDIYVSPHDMDNLARLELDVKRCIVAGHGKTISNIGDGSTQWNRSAGCWQIDKPGGGWVDTAFEPILPPTWTHLSFRHWMDGAKYSVLSTNWGGMAFNVPASMQNIPLLSSNWDAVVAVQIQFELFTPGVVTVYARNISLSLNDKPF